MEVRVSQFDIGQPVAELGKRSAENWVMLWELSGPAEGGAMKFCMPKS